MHAAQITPRAHRWLRLSHSARVLHLFADVVNLVNERGDLLSVVAPTVGPGPFTVTVEGDFTAGLDAAQPVQIDGEQQTITVGPLVVETGEATIWQPQPQWPRLWAADLAAWPLPPPLPDGLATGLRRLLDGVTSGDTSAIRAGAATLAGRGGGLTPAGDDVLMGVLYGLWVWKPQPDWMALIIETAVPRTTTLSANLLRAAAAGEATWQWHDLVAGRPGAVERLLTVGHTSGADAWAGFTAVGMIR